MTNELLDSDAVVRPRPHRVLPPHTGANECLDESVEQSAMSVSASNCAEAKSHIIPQSSSPLLKPLPVSRTTIRPHLHIPVPKLHRPIALKVSRPIPKSAVEEFYNETYKYGIKAEDVHEATLLAHEWHRKWTQQDEQGHTMPEQELDCNPQSLLSLLRESQELLLATKEHTREVHSYNPSDRVSGAKNPSPEEVQQDLFYERKRLRLTTSGSFSSVSPDSQVVQEQSSKAYSQYGPPSSKRRVVGFVGSDLQSGLAPPEFPPHAQFNLSPAAPQGLLKPTALRVLLPDSLQISKALEILSAPRDSNQVPEDIMPHHTALSPLTLPSIGSSYRQHKSAIVEDDMSEHSRLSGIPSVISHPSKEGKSDLRRLPEIDSAREGILHRLAVTGGDVVNDPDFNKHLDVLKQHYSSTKNDTRFSDDVHATSEGMWLTLTKPTYFGNLGTNDDGDPMYTMGRMAFDMFSPTRLVCSLQGNFNSVQKVSDEDRATMLDSVPKALRDEVEGGNTILRTYNIITALTIEPNLAAWPNAPNKDVRRPIRGLMTTTGYTLPDPENPNRHSVWITGGRIEPNNDPVDQREWKRQFGKNPPKHGLGEQAKLLAVKLLMGATIPKQMEDDGSMNYTFQRPLGGHGLAYVDTLYVDDSLRIVKGHRGTIFVFSKLPEAQLQ